MLPVSFAVFAWSCGGASSADGGTDAGAAPDCSGGNQLELAFSPMYSAFDGTHTFQIPVIVNGFSASSVKWSASDPTAVTLTPDVNVGGAMITVRSAPTTPVTITANVGNLCGTSVLTIDSNTADDWTAGEQRYNNGVDLRADAGRRFGGCDGGACADVACTNCHGPTAAGPFSDVAHTPEQTGGFSDSDLEAIITRGEVPGWLCTGTGFNATVTTSPDAGYYDSTIINYCRWQSFHAWAMTSSELSGIICYLRSLTPAPQQGSSNFGGRGPRDGGMGPPRDGG